MRCLGAPTSTLSVLCMQIIIMCLVVAMKTHNNHCLVTSMRVACSCLESAGLQSAAIERQWSLHHESIIYKKGIIDSANIGAAQIDLHSLQTFGDTAV